MKNLKIVLSMSLMCTLQLIALEGPRPDVTSGKPEGETGQAKDVKAENKTKADKARADKASKDAQAENHTSTSKETDSTTQNQGTEKKGTSKDLNLDNNTSEVTTAKPKSGTFEFKEKENLVNSQTVETNLKAEDIFKELEENPDFKINDSQLQQVLKVMYDTIVSMMEGGKNLFSDMFMTRYEETFKNLLDSPNIKPATKESLQKIYDDLKTISELKKNGESGDVIEQYSSQVVGEFSKLANNSLGRENAQDVEIYFQAEAPGHENFKNRRALGKEANDGLFKQQTLNKELGDTHSSFEKIDQLKIQNKNNPEQLKKINEMESNAVNAITDSIISSGVSDAGVKTALAKLDPKRQKQVSDALITKKSVTSSSAPETLTSAQPSKLF